MMRQNVPGDSSVHLRDLLRPVMRRWHIASGAQYAVWAMVVCAGFTIAGTLAAWSFQTPFPSWLALLLLVIGPTAAFFGGLLKRYTATDAATLSDCCYGLQDRLVSAVEFERIDDATPLHKLQIADARRRAMEVDPRVVVPLNMPRHAPLGVTLAIIAVGLVVVPRSSPDAISAPSTPSPAIVEESNRLTAQAEELAHRAADEHDALLRQMADRMREAADAMRKESTDVGDALEEISRLQETIRQQQAEFKIELVQAQLQTVAEALRDIPGLEETAQAIEQFDFEKAAERLENFDPEEIDSLAAQTAGERLGEAAEQLEQSNLDQLAEPVRKMGQGLQDENHATVSSAAKQLAKELREHGKLTQTNSRLQSQLAAMSESKARIVGGQSVDAAGQKSQQTSSEVGTGVDGDLRGDLSKLDSQREPFEIPSELGSGDSAVKARSRNQATTPRSERTAMFFSTMRSSHAPCSRQSRFP